MPYWKSNKAVLTLVKSGEDWLGAAELGDDMERKVAEVSGISDEQWEGLLSGMYRAANSDADEEEIEEE